MAVIRVAVYFKSVESLPSDSGVEMTTCLIFLQTISGRRRHLDHSPRILQRKVFDLKNDISTMLEPWLDSRVHSRRIVSEVLGNLRYRTHLSDLSVK